MTILSQNQTRILGMLSKEKSVCDHFLEDLDFFVNEAKMLEKQILE